MATYYIDLENGNDSNNGTSFANRRKTIESFKDADAANDEYRIMASPDPTLVGSCTMPDRWAHENYSGNLIDWDQNSITGQIAFSTTTGQTQITRNKHDLVTGDTIWIKECMISNADMNGTWEVTKVDNNNFKLNGYTSTLSTTHTDGSSGNMGRWQRLNALRFKLASAVTQTVASTGQRSAWTASSNVTAILKWPSSGSWDWSGGMASMEHVYSDLITIDASFGTGKAAYWATGTLDLSGYQQISLQIAPVSGAKPASSNISLRLCTDTSGDTSVHTVPLQYTNVNNEWFIPNLKDFGANLNSAIKSVAIYVDTDEGAQSFKLSNIIACKASSSADSLTHRSLIGLNTTNDPFWYAIGSIVGTRLLLYANTSNASYAPYTYYSMRAIWRHANTGDTQNLYKREPLLLNGFADAQNDKPEGINIDSQFTTGSNGNEITFSGGWNRTDMSSKATNGITWIDNQTNTGRPEWNSGDCNFSDFGFTRFNEVKCSGYRTKWVNIHAANLRDKLEFQGYQSRGINAIYTQSRFQSSWTSVNTNVTHDPDNFVLKGSCTGTQNSINYNYIKWGEITCGPCAGINRNLQLQYWYSGGVGTINVGYNTRWNSNSGLELAYIQSGPCTIDTLNIYGCGVALKYQNNQNSFWEIGTYNHYDSPDDTADGFFQGYHGAADASSKPQYTIETSAAGASPLIIMGGTTVAPWKVETGAIKTYNVTNTYSGTEFDMGNTDKTGYIKANKWDGTAGNDFYITGKGKVSPETTIRKTASGKSWKIDIAGSGVTSSKSLDVPLAKVAVNASALVTAKLWVYRDGTGINGGLKVLGNTLIGVTAASAVASGSAGAWEEVTLTFTPSAAGFVEFESTCYYVSNDAHNLYIDDLTVTQA